MGVEGAGACRIADPVPLGVPGPFGQNQAAVRHRGPSYVQVEEEGAYGVGRTGRLLVSCRGPGMEVGKEGVPLGDRNTGL